MFYSMTLLQRKSRLQTVLKNKNNSLSFIILILCSVVEEVFDVLGDKQNVAFDDLAKLHQLGLVKCIF